MGIEEYKKSSHNIATNEQLVLRVYEKAITLMWEAREKMLNGSGDFVNELHVTRQLFSELVSCLDYEEGGDITGQLHQLYIFILTELSAAGFDQSVERLENAISVAEQLYEGFFGAFSHGEEGEVVK
jgi:flagellar protein FliS